MWSKPDGAKPEGPGRTRPKKKRASSKETNQLAAPPVVHRRRGGTGWRRAPRSARASDAEPLRDPLQLLAQQPELALVYGDSAYRATMHVIPATRHALASPAHRTLNNIMKPMRVIVEQNFDCVSQVAGISRVQLSLGSGPIGKVYPVATLLTNIYTLLYGNTITCSVPGAMDVLHRISLEAYLDV
jgi:hypothetical protein